MSQDCNHRAFSPIWKCQALLNAWPYMSLYDCTGHTLMKPPFSRKFFLP